MKKPYFLTSLSILIIVFTLSPLQSQETDDFDLLLNKTIESESLDSDFDRLLKEAENDVNGKDTIFEEEWRKKDEEFNLLWQTAKSEIEKKWDKALRSTNKEWVDYGSDMESMSYVNFEDGYIELTAIVPEDEKDNIDRGKKKIERQLKKILSTDLLSGVDVLSGQIKDKDGDTVTPPDMDRYIRDDVIEKVKPETKTFTSKDGVKRRKMKVRIKMVPNHLKIRVERFLPLVQEYSRQYAVLIPLILAVIHTESYFNPLAQSPASAYGLMQLIPKYGARDAYRHIYKKDRIVPPSYLYNPQNNIELGAAFLHILLNYTFNRFDDELKLLYLAISAYNWGPGSINRNILKRYPVNKMDAARLYQILRENTPQETREYLKKVIERMKVYEGFR